MQVHGILCIVSLMTAEVIHIGGRPGDLDRIKKAAELVEAGGLVAFPTETVYGLAYRSSAGSQSRHTTGSRRSVCPTGSRKPSSGIAGQ